MSRAISNGCAGAYGPRIVAIRPTGSATTRVRGRRSPGLRPGSRELTVRRWITGLDGPREDFIQTIGSATDVIGLAPCRGGLFESCVVLPDTFWPFSYCAPRATFPRRW